MDKLKTRLKGTNNVESKEAGLAFQPNPEDVFITTFPKCGTTWVSMILHCLRTRGHMEFGEITEVVPWTICAQLCGQDLTAAQVGTPRLYKSHENYDDVPKGGKYVYVARNPDDVVVSFHEFLLSVASMEVDEVSFRDFFFEFFLPDRNIWTHFLSFYKKKEDPNVLWLFYEDLLEDREKCIRKIAEFAGIPLDDELMTIVMEQSSFAFMKQHATKFDDHFLLHHAYENMNKSLPPEEQLHNVSANKVHKGKRVKTILSDEIKAEMQNRWEMILGTETGTSCYEELRSQLSILS